MIISFKKQLLISLFISSGYIMTAQILTSGFFPKKNELTIAPSYSYKKSTNFYRGKNLNIGNPAGLGVISSSIINLYGEYGITDRISVDLSLPYIEVKSGTGQLDPVQQKSTVNGFQDLNFYIKGKLADVNSKIGKLSFGIAAGLGLPIGDYEGGGVLSLGNDTTSYNSDLIFQYQAPFNLFFEAQGGYSLRDNNRFNTPDAISYGFKLGYFTEHFYLHAELDVQDSIDGFDIGSPEFVAAGGPAGLPGADVDFQILNFTMYVPLYKQILGLSTGYTTTIGGRNFSKDSGVSIGLVYKSY